MTKGGAKSLTRSGHVAVGQAALDAEDRLNIGDGHAPAQQHLQAFDDIAGQARQVGQSPLADLACLTVGLAQQYSRG